MKIHFKSIYGPKDNKNIIEFYSKLEKYQENDHHVLDFWQKDEKHNIRTIIEYNENKITIYSGEATLVLEKNTTVKNKYISNGIEMFVYTHLDALDIHNSYLKLHYYVSPTSDEIEYNNEFDLMLEFLE